MKIMCIIINGVALYRHRHQSHRHNCEMWMWMWIKTEIMLRELMKKYYVERKKETAWENWIIKKTYFMCVEYFEYTMWNMFNVELSILKLIWIFLPWLWTILYQKCDINNT